MTLIHFLNKFLEMRVSVLMQIKIRVIIIYKVRKEFLMYLFSEIKSKKRVLCKNNETHALQVCLQFIGFSVNERVEYVRNNKWCFKCLSPECFIKQCHSKICSVCKKPHNKLLHFDREIRSKSLPINVSLGSSSVCDPPSCSHMPFICFKSRDCGENFLP